MHSQEKGAKFEIITKDFFVWLFEEIGFTITKERIQFSGTQDGFDIHIIVTFNNFERQIHIECKDYNTDLDIGNIFKKALDLEKNYLMTDNDLFIAISPRANFKNADNSEKTSPILNEKFSFKSYLLDKSNGINKLFALNDEYYKEIYKKKVDFTFDRVKELEVFKNIIFSRKPFKKIVLSEKDRTTYLGNIEKTENYLKRLLGQTFNNKDDFFFKNESNFLDDIVSNKDKVLILGNPGLGKSTELKEFALSKWRIGEQDSYIPIYRNLKNFTVSHKIEDLLPKNIEDITNSYILFDGIDEIQDPHDFISKLEVFINQINSQYKSYKFILSCRTNIYESVIKNISEFESYYLNNLSYENALWLLEKQLDNPKILDSLDFQKVHYDFLKNPFLIEILCNYINKNKVLPNSSSELWKSYIDKRLENDEKDKLLKQSLNTPVIINYSKKVSIICELMKSNSITENQIVELFSNHYQEFFKNPLIEKDLNSNCWSFEHRNIQEYFAAKFLSELPFEKIIRFISISGEKQTDTVLNKVKRFLGLSKNIMVSKTHPSLFNTISFLLNIVDDTKRKKLVNWLEENELEILFNMDSDRITDEIKQSVFQNYFKKVCVENTFWISHNKSFDVKAIAKFGDNENNFSFLISFLENPLNYFRVIISALELLGYMTCPSDYIENIKELFMSKLKGSNLDSTNSKENDLKIKSNIISCLDRLNIYNNDTDNLKNIIEIFKKDTHTDINYSILSLINNQENIDDYYDFIYEEFLRLFKIKQNDYDSPYLESTYFLEEIILKGKSKKNFLKVLCYFFSDDHYGVFDNSFGDKIIKKIKEFVSTDKEFIIELLEAIKDRKYWFYREYELSKIINEAQQNDLIINKFIKNELPFDEGKYLIVKILNTENIYLIIEYFINKNEPKEEVEVFRNILGNTYSRELALLFEEIMISKGLEFEEKLYTQEKIKELDNQRELKKQQNFDILFDNEQLKIKIKNIFNEIGTEYIDWVVINKYEATLYKKNRNDYKVEPSMLILRDLLRNSNQLSFLEVSKIIEKEIIIVKEISRQIKNIKGINISQTQINVIYEWCLKFIKTINYNSLVIPNEEDNSFRLTHFYFGCKYIYEFQQQFGFEIPKDFYLNTLVYCGFDLFTNRELDSFLFIQRKINNKEDFDKQVVKNIIEHKFQYQSIKSHILYAIDNNLIDSFECIKEYFLNSSFFYIQDNELEKFYEITKDIKFLKKCCDNIHHNLCWESIKVLIKLDKEHYSFIINKANQYLESSESKYNIDALGVLFKLNQPNSLKKYLDLLNTNSEHSITSDYYSYYSGYEENSVIEKLYSLLFSDDEVKYHYARNIFKSYIFNISSKSHNDYKRIQNILSKVKESLIRKKSDLYYINTIIEDCNKSYINYLSKPLEFQEAKTKIEAY